MKSMRADSSGSGSGGGITPLFERVGAKRTFEEVAEQIRREVAAGRLKPGDRLPPEREFAEQLGVSRSAIREALRALENSGLVHCQQGMGGGVFIQSYDSKPVTRALADSIMLGDIPSSSVGEVRIILAEQAIRLAVQRATEADFLALEADIDNVEELTKRGDFSGRHLYVNEFYKLLGQATHNQVMVMMLEALTELTRALLLKANFPPRKNVVEIRRKIVRLMRAGDADSAAAEMRADLKRVHDALEAPRS